MIFIAYVLINVQHWTKMLDTAFIPRIKDQIFWFTTINTKLTLNYTFQNQLLQENFFHFLFDFYCIFTYKCSASNENVGHRFKPVFQFKKKNQSTKSTKHVFDFYWPVLIFIAYFHKSSSLRMNTLNVLHNQFTRSTGYVFDFYLYFHNCSALQLIKNVGY